MLKPIASDFSGLIMVTGPTNSGKSQFAEFLIKEQEYITYIATSKPRENDPDWQHRINIHRKRRPNKWKLIEHPLDICKAIDSISFDNSILIDSLGGLVEQHLMEKQDKWEQLQKNFITSLNKAKKGIIIVIEEIGWGLVPSTSIGHLFRERHSKLSLSLSRYSTKKWLVVQGSAIDITSNGYQII